MPITAEFTADFSQFNSAAEEAGRAIGTFVGAVTDFATDYIKAFAEEEAATARLTSALEAQGTLTSTVIGNYQAMAEQFQKTTRYSDDAITAAQTALTTIGRIGPEQMQPALQATVDLAAALGIGVPEAANKLATVIGSDGAKLGTLKKYLGDVEVKGKDASEIIAIFNSKFGGAAAKDMATTEGKLAGLNNKFDDFKSKVGEALNTALMPFLDAFLSLPDGVQTLIGGMALLVAALTPVAIAFGAMMTAIGPLVPLIGTALTGALSSLAVLLGPAGLVVAAIVGVYVAFKNWDKITSFVSGVYDAIKTYLVDKFNALVGAILKPIDAVTGAFKMMYDKVVGHSYVPDMIGGIASEFSKLDDVMVRPAREAAAAVAGYFGSTAQGSVAATLYGTGSSFTAGEAAAIAAGQFINFAGSGIATGRAGFGAIQNNFQVNGTAEETARKIADIIARSVREGARFGGA